LVRRSRTSDNRGNLSRAYLDAVVALYEGTALAAQELEGEFLDDVEGALWTQEELDENRVGALPSLERPLIAIGLDPSVAENPRDECGIVVVVSSSEKRAVDRHVYVMEDASLRGSPAVWAAQVVDVARRWGAPVIAEYNQGGDALRNVIQNIDPAVRIIPVHARFGKALRAEPVVLASQQGRLHLVGEFPTLEAQATSWQPEVTKKSPDRVDAMVYGVTALLSETGNTLSQSPIRITSSASRRSAASRRILERTGGRVLGAKASDANGRELDSLPAYMQESVRVLFGRGFR
jgi:phage terminase large subunit-like protein